MTTVTPQRALREQRRGDMLARLKELGLKLTPQRRAIVRLFAADESHPTAQELFERLQAEYPKMSFATVYNTLDALTKAGLSATLRLGSQVEGGREANAARFDPNVLPHHHAVCDRCGAIADVPARSLAPGESAVRSLEETAPGFAVRSVERIYRGVCARCSREASRKKISEKEKRT